VKHGRGAALDRLVERNDCFPPNAVQPNGTDPSIDIDIWPLGWVVAKSLPTNNSGA
jgi:hypothetical protein